MVVTGVADGTILYECLEKREVKKKISSKILNFYINFLIYFLEKKNTMIKFGNFTRYWK